MYTIALYMYTVNTFRQIGGRGMRSIEKEITAAKLLSGLVDLADITENGIIAIDSESNLIVMNKTAEKILGIDAKEGIGKNLSKILSNPELMDTLKTGEIQKNRRMDIGERTIITNRMPITSGDESIGAIAIFHDMTEHYNLLKDFHNEKNVSEILNTILETVYDGIVVVDKEGYVTMLSKAYAKFLNLNEKEVIGKHVSKVIENTRMHIVARTGVAEYADPQKVNGNYMIATRIPIIKNGETVGAVGKVLYRNIDELNMLQKKIGIMENQLEQYKGEIKQLNKATYSFSSIIGGGSNIIEAIKYARRASKTDSNVLLIGESGTGKELFAHAIHQSSNRKYGPFIKINCAAIPSELLESELFGYEEGSFTGAKKGGKLGKFELAEGGTIFLDEIGDMPLYMQAKLLRVIQEREVERIGGTRPRAVNVRIIAATNVNLEEMVAEGKYRQDLYYRLNVFLISIPALRERKEDIRPLANHFLNSLNNKYFKNIEGYSEEAIKFLTRYDWPGNIRELSNVIERAVNIIDNEKIITPEHFPQKILGDDFIKEIKSLQDTLEEAEKNAIIESLRASKGNRTKAAKLLNVSRSTFYEKMIKFNINDGETKIMK
jgi:PAS domain S-box-containing protein